ncbi:MAG: NAD(P)/FAD-dependent oxidoreductase [Paracoccaceae bacterium]
MAESADILIVGGGAMGSSAAWWLKGFRPELRVTVLERDPSYARAATALSVASVRSQFSNPVNVLISRFGAGFVRDFGAQVGEAGGVRSLGFRENGYLFLSGSEGGAALMEELAAMQRGLGAATEVLGRSELARRFPWMRLDDVVAGSFGPRDEGWFDNMGLLGGLKSGARARGAVFVAAEAARLVANDGRVTGVALADGKVIGAGAVLLAAGTGVTPLLGTLGLAWPVEPRKRTVFVVDAPEARHPGAPLIIDHSGIYLRPEHDQWITAMVPEDDGPCAEDDWEPDHGQFEAEIWPRLWNRAEGFAATRVKRLWVGHYDYNRLDQNAILGRHPDVAGLYVASGFSGHGLQQAPAVGRGLAELILTGAWQSLDLSELQPERLAAGRPFLEKAIV